MSRFRLWPSCRTLCFLRPAILENDPMMITSPHFLTQLTLVLQRFMSTFTKKQANDVRPGNILDIDGKLYQILKASHAQGTGRQLGNVQFELRDVLSKSKRPLRLRPSDTIDVVRLDERKYQFLYKESDTYYCMDPETFEQISLDEDIFGGQSQYLIEGGEIMVSTHNSQVICGTLPTHVTLKVAEAAPHIKGATQAPQYKGAILETGAKISVPPFVAAGDEIVVDTSTGEFVKRA